MKSILTVAFIIEFTGVIAHAPYHHPTDNAIGVDKPADDIYGNKDTGGENTREEVAQGNVPDVAGKGTGGSYSAFVQLHDSRGFGGSGFMELRSDVVMQTGDFTFEQKDGVLTQLGPYKVSSKSLGDGATGEVFKGEHGESKQLVAIKHMADDAMKIVRQMYEHADKDEDREEALDNLRMTTGLHELEIMNTIRDKPGVIQIIAAYDKSTGTVGTVDDESILEYQQDVYLVMELANAGSWKDNPPANEDEACTQLIMMLLAMHVEERFHKENFRVFREFHPKSTSNFS